MHYGEEVLMKCILSVLSLIVAYNRRFATRLGRKHPNVWTFIQLIQDEHVRFEHLMTQLSSGASGHKSSATRSAFQRRFETLNIRFENSEIDAKQMLNGLSLLIGRQKKMMFLMSH